MSGDFGDKPSKDGDKEEDGENPGTYEYKSDATFVNSDYWLVGEGIVAYVNGGYKHLKFYQEQKGIYLSQFLFSLF